VLVHNETRNTVLAESADVADSGAARRRGLLGRNGLSRGQGLWIVPCEAVHTWGMRFSIDVVYLDRGGKVRKIRTALRPWRLSMCLSAHSVLELPGGVADESGTRVGDQLRISVL
jgi:uncharacterized membrane protein (UPF0127 family)